MIGLPGPAPDLHRRAGQLVQQPVDLVVCCRDDRAVSRKGGFLAGVFVLESRVNLSADDEDLEAHAQLAGECVCVFLRLRFSVASDGV